MPFSIFFYPREKAIIGTKLHLCNFENEFSTLPVVFQLHFSFCLDYMVTSRSHTCLFSPSSNHPFSSVKETQLLPGSCRSLHSFAFVCQFVWDACICLPCWSHALKSCNQSDWQLVIILVINEIICLSAMIMGGWDTVTGVINKKKLGVCVCVRGLCASATLRKTLAWVERDWYASQISWLTPSAFYPLPISHSVSFLLPLLN